MIPLPDASVTSARVGPERGGPAGGVGPAKATAETMITREKKRFMIVLHGSRSDRRSFDNHTGGFELGWLRRALVLSRNYACWVEGKIADRAILKWE
jgi:hypothetical protein